MNFKKLMLVIAAAVVLVGTWKFFTRVDRTDPAAVATAFTKAMKAKNTSKASNFIVPDQADAWLVAADETVAGMKSGAKERFYERIPEAPVFTTPVTVAGKTTIGDPNYALEITQIDGKWYVIKSPM